MLRHKEFTWRHAITDLEDFNSENIDYKWKLYALKDNLPLCCIMYNVQHFNWTTVVGIPDHTHLNTHPLPSNLHFWKSLKAEITS